jgi:hypothetical protein
MGLLNKMWDKNEQRAPVGDRQTEKRRAWDVVVQVAPRSGGSADQVCKCAPHAAVRRKRWAHNV